VLPWFDVGGGERSLRHLDTTMVTRELMADALRVSGPTQKVTVAGVYFARHDRVHVDI